MERAHADWLNSRFDRVEQVLVRGGDATEGAPSGTASHRDAERLNEAISHFEAQLSALRQVESRLVDLNAQYTQKIDEIYTQLQDPTVQETRQVRNDLVNRLSEIDRSTNIKVQNLKRSFIDKL